jgi:predicted NBD/HSP70 family sugar kinase
MLDRSGDRLAWSPIAHASGQSIVEPLQARFNLPAKLIKRGPLLAEGTRVLYPDLREASLATVFIGSTVAMGLSGHGRPLGRGDEGATEFGHMNHMPSGARCRCGMRGCIEAYAADYGVLRTAYGVPEDTAPAPSVPAAEYLELIRQGHAGRRNVVHAFRQAGRAIGYGLSRLLTVVDPTSIVIVGPGAAAFDLMHEEIAAALADSLVCRVNGLPDILAHADEREPIFQGMLVRALADLDAEHLAPMPAAMARA